MHVARRAGSGRDWGSPAWTSIPGMGRWFTGWNPGRVQASPPGASMAASAGSGRGRRRGAATGREGPHAMGDAASTNSYGRTHTRRHHRPPRKHQSAADPPRILRLIPPVGDPRSAEDTPNRAEEDSMCQACMTRMELDLHVRPCRAAAGAAAGGSTAGAAVATGAKAVVPTQAAARRQLGGGWAATAGVRTARKALPSLFLLPSLLRRRLKQRVRAA